MQGAEAFLGGVVQRGVHRGVQENSGDFVVTFLEWQRRVWGGLSRSRRIWGRVMSVWGGLSMIRRVWGGLRWFGWVKED